MSRSTYGHVEEKPGTTREIRLIAIIQQMLRQEPDLQWLLKTPLPIASSQKDIPSLLVGNTSPEERQAISGWVRHALSQSKAKGNAGYIRQRYEAFLTALEQVD